ncbi:hypothetical protein SCOR_16235 [Sulfidibacter corallicola]|uniref:MalT-like TPR region domain-containing protein n=1 Tax=Sulfidibacter corallicola TaxID=2818388 RepID=A0A8A4U5H3_SULCO|nr:hypothetical protein [Sulfidibacter corallicola]QTD53985.1 hypothetical protein J3U87_16185 [Sulfidibacter corallicola]
MKTESPIFRNRDLLQFPTLLQHVSERESDGFLIVITCETEALEEAVVQHLGTELAGDFLLRRVNYSSSGYAPLHKALRHETQQGDADGESEHGHAGAEKPQAYLLRGFPYEIFDEAPDLIAEELALLMEHLDHGARHALDKHQRWFLFWPPGVEQQMSEGATEFYQQVCYTARFSDHTRFDTCFRFEPERAEASLLRAERQLTSAQAKRRKAEAHNRLARMIRKYGHLKDAETHLDQATTSEFGPTFERNVILERARLAHWQGRSEEARSLLEKAGAVRDTTDRASSRTLLALEWGWFALLGGSPGKANKHLSEAIEAAAELHGADWDRGFHRLRAAIFSRQGLWRETKGELGQLLLPDEDSLLLQARALIKLGETGDALEALGHLFVKHRRRLSQSVRGRALGLAALVFSRVGHVQEAREHALQGLRILQDSGIRIYIPEAYMYLGLVHQGPEARAHFSEAHRLAGELGDSFIEAKSLVRLAEHAIDNDEEEEAERFGERALDLAQTHDYREVEGMARSVRCYLQIKRNQWALALGQGCFALNLLDKTGVASPQARLFLRLADVHAKLQNKQHAIKFLSYALETYRKADHLPGEAKALNALAQFYRDQGNRSQAENYTNRASMVTRLLG